MAGQLLYREGSGADSAGNTRSCPPQPAPATGLGGPHDVRQRIIRGQGIGAARCTGKRMCVGLGAASIVCPASYIWLLPFSRVMPAPTLRPLHHIVRMAGQLLDRERGLADSAGNTRPQPSTSRLPGIRRGLHSAPHSTAKYGWPLLTTRQTEDGCVIHHCRQKTYRCGSVSCCYRY